MDAALIRGPFFEASSIAIVVFVVGNFFPLTTRLFAAVTSRTVVRFAVAARRDDAIEVVLVSGSGGISKQRGSHPPNFSQNGRVIAEI